MLPQNAAGAHHGMCSAQLCLKVHVTVWLTTVHCCGGWLVPQREVRVIENRLTMDNRNTGKWVVSQFTHINFGVAKLEITLRNPAAYQAAVAAAAVAALPSLPTATPVAGIGTTPPVSTGPSVYGDHGIMMTSLGGTTDPPRTGGSGGGGGGGGAGASTAASAPVLIDGKPQRQQNIDAFIL